jgi:hypothetical protein
MDEAATSYELPPAFRLFEIVFATFILLVLMRIATRQLRRALERVDRDIEDSAPFVGHAIPSVSGEPLSEEAESGALKTSCYVMLWCPFYRPSTV